MIIKELANAIHVSCYGFEFDVAPSIRFKGLLTVNGGGGGHYKVINGYVRSPLGAALLVDGYCNLSLTDILRLYHKLLCIRY